MEALVSRRLETRHEVALSCVARILQAAREHGIDITLVGSLARADFRPHSDIDLLVRGPVASKGRLLVERLVADCMRDTAIPYDLIFEADLTKDRVQELLNDGV
jgi:predicted nucleotidyltransferase